MKLSEIKREVKLLADNNLGHNDSIRVVCPVCNGGSSRERSMSIRHSDRGVGFCCFRDRCGVRGYLSGGVVFGNGDDATSKRSTSPLLDITALPDEYYTHLPVNVTSVAPQWEQKRRMVLYPVLSYWGTELGYVQRHYKSLNDWWSGPKAINIKHNPKSEEPFLHFPHLTREQFDGSLVIVEDWPSAEAVAQYRPSCALLGTNLSPSELGLFLKLGVRHLIICLDNDALATAAVLKRKVGLVFDQVDVMFVDKDPKDMSEGDLRERFKQ